MGFLDDRSLTSLIVSNVATIIIALFEGWDPSVVVCIYWFQSVVIGVFTVVRLLDTKYADLSDELKSRFSKVDAKGFRDNPGLQKMAKKGPETVYRYAKIILAGFFTIHYGLFHYGYYEFINPVKVFSSLGSENASALALAMAFFILNHLYSLLYNRRQGAYRKVDPMEIMVAPYHRIMPMHVTIIFGTIFMMVLSALGYDPTKPVLVFFLVVKTYADAMSHTKKHKKD